MNDEQADRLRAARDRKPNLFGNEPCGDTDEHERHSWNGDLGDEGYDCWGVPVPTPVLDNAQTDREAIERFRREHEGRHDDDQRSFDIPPEYRDKVTTREVAADGALSDEQIDEARREHERAIGMPMFASFEARTHPSTANRAEYESDLTTAVIGDFAQAYERAFDAGRVRDWARPGPVGVFAGLPIQVDDTLPPDVIEIRGKINVRIRINPAMEIHHVEVGKRPDNPAIKANWDTVTTEDERAVVAKSLHSFDPRPRRIGVEFEVPTDLAGFSIRANTIHHGWTLTNQERVTDRPDWTRLTFEQDLPIKSGIVDTSQPSTPFTQADYVARLNAAYGEVVDDQEGNL